MQTLSRKSFGGSDKHYFSPNGEKFTSLAAVNRHLQKYMGGHQIMKRSSPSDDEEEMSDGEREEEWDDLFRRLCEFKRRRGHVNPERKVPQLGEWAYTMRELYAKNESGENTFLTREKIAKLEGIGFSFCVATNEGGAEEVGAEGSSDGDGADVLSCCC